MTDIPLMYVVTCDGDTSDADYLGVSKSLTATGSQYRIVGPLAKAWASALMAERKRALEEAAVTCENIYSPDGHASHDWPTPEECAAAIRKLGED